MIPKDCKRLAEVDFPIAVVSRHAAREKSIRHGHPSTLHLWWARRPLAACRAMLMALLLPDPCESLCPDDFKLQARALLPKAVGPLDDGDPALRKKLLDFIGSFANWDNSANPTYLEVARGLVRAAYPEEPPLVVDPFAGGGSIPLEALRVGCEAFASDLNPVACLILKVMLEDIPRHGPALAEELRRVGADIKKAAEKELGEFYPPDPDGAVPIAYIWSRTVRCETPNCGAEIPLVRSFWLCKKEKRRRALRYQVIRERGAAPGVEFEIFEPTTDRDVQHGTVSRAKATCPCCNLTLPPERVRAQLAAQKGGADATFDPRGRRTGGARLLAVVTLTPGEQGRHYRLPTSRDYDAVRKAQHKLQQVSATRLPNGLSPVPDEPTPAGGGSGAGRTFSVQKYGMMTFGDLFTARQKLALLTLISKISQLRTNLLEARTVAGLALSRFTDICNGLCQWKNTSTQVVHLFTRQALPVLWDFGEPGLFAGQAGDYSVTLGTMVEVAENLASVSTIGQVEPADATRSPLPPASCPVWFTDPPYYDAIPYSDLSDFFYVWLKRTGLVGAGAELTPKDGEIVQDETKSFDGRPKDRQFFEKQMRAAFSEGRRVLRDDGVACVVFAHKTTEGWEALLSGMVEGGWVVTASWPVATEMTTRLRARDSAALATSVHLVCRPRPHDAPIGDWTQVLRELPRRVGDWMERLQGEGIRGADLVFACIGPALETYSRYSKVVDAQDREIPLGGDPEAKEPHLRGYLSYVWEVVGRTALEQVLGTAEARARNSAAGVLEEDARLTALFLWTLQATNHAAADDQSPENDEEPEEDDEEPQNGKKKPGFSLIYDVVRRFAQPLGIHLADWEGRIIDTKKGVVRLLPIRERAPQLFGEGGADLAADRIERAPTGATQLDLVFDELAAAPEIRPRGRRARAAAPDEALRTRREATTLDRVHAAMLLQASGRANALRTLLKAEIERSPDFLRLANALSALYPDSTQEKRLVQAMVQAAPR